MNAHRKSLIDIDEDKIASLLERVCAAQGPDRHLDQDLYCDLGLADFDKNGNMLAYRAPYYTQIYEESLKIFVNFLPTADINVYWPAEFGASAEVVIPNVLNEPFWVTASTPPLVVLAALLEGITASAGWPRPIPD